MRSQSHRHLVGLIHAALIAALYVLFTHLSAAVGLASMAIQVRISEAFCILPIFTPWAIPGLWVGCLIANLTTGAYPFDVLFGSLATLIGALGAYCLRRIPWLAPLPTVLANAAIVPPVLIFVYGLEDAWWFLVLTVGAGEILSAYVLGLVLWVSLRPVAPRLFPALPQNAGKKREKAKKQDG